MPAAIFGIAKYGQWEMEQGEEQHQKKVLVHVLVWVHVCWVWHTAALGSAFQLLSCIRFDRHATMDVRSSVHRWRRMPQQLQHSRQQGRQPRCAVHVPEVLSAPVLGCRLCMCAGKLGNDGVHILDHVATIEMSLTKRG